MKKIKRMLVSTVLLILIACLLIGCGATVSTKLNVDENFTGQRVIEVKINNEDLSESVTGGIEALKKVADENLPEQMTCTQSSDDGAAILTFTIDFKDIDDYRNKVIELIAKGSNKELAPEVHYENLNTVFKSGVYLQENFTSFDLLQWYFDALQGSGIITYEDTSDWYEFGESKIVIGEAEYDSNSELYINERELCCVDAMDVETYLNADGTFKRVFIFSAYENTVNALLEKNCNLSTYISNLTPEGDSFEEKVEYSEHEYKIIINAANVEQLIEKTDSILQTKNDFSIEIQKDEERIGKAKVVVNEKLDGSFYLNYDYSRPLESKIYLFDNVAFAEEIADDVYINGNELVYYPSASEVRTFNFDWQISFASVEIYCDIKNENNAVVKFIFNSEKALSEELRSSAIAAIEEISGEYGEFSKNGEGCIISFEGSVLEITKKINDFLKSTDAEHQEGKSYFEINYSPAETASKFTNSYSGTITYDISSIIGDTNVLFNDSEGLLSDYYYQGDFIIDDDGNRTALSQGSVDFTLVKTSLLMVILETFFVITFVVGIIVIILNRKKLGEIAKSIKHDKGNNNTGTSSGVDNVYVTSQETIERKEAEYSKVGHIVALDEETEELI